MYDNKELKFRITTLKGKLEVINLCSCNRGMQKRVELENLEVLIVNKRRGQRRWRDFEVLGSDIFDRALNDGSGTITLSITSLLFFFPSSVVHRNYFLN